MKKVFAIALLLSTCLTFLTTLYLQAQSNALEAERFECLQALMDSNTEEEASPTNGSEVEPPTPGPGTEQPSPCPYWD